MAPPVRPYRPFLRATPKETHTDATVVREEHLNTRHGSVKTVLSIINLSSCEPL